MKISVRKNGDCHDLMVTPETLDEAFRLGELLAMHADDINVAFMGDATLIFRLVEEPITPVAQ
jgi:hypothetical protein